MRAHTKLQMFLSLWLLCGIAWAPFASVARASCHDGSGDPARIVSIHEHADALDTSAAPSHNDHRAHLCQATCGAYAIPSIPYESRAQQNAEAVVSAWMVRYQNAVLPSQERPPKLLFA